MVKCWHLVLEQRLIAQWSGAGGAKMGPLQHFTSQLDVKPQEGMGSRGRCPPRSQPTKRPLCHTEER